MIGRRAKSFCCEDISLIENYELAANSNKWWDCHHKNEIILNKSPKELIEMGLYYNRPASELIFLTHSEHMKIHKTGRVVSEETKKKISVNRTGKNVGKPSGMKGKHQSEHTKKLISIATSGENNPMYGTTKEKCPAYKTTWMTNGEKCVRAYEDEIEMYKSIGFVIGRKKRAK